MQDTCFLEQLKRCLLASIIRDAHGTVAIIFAVVIPALLVAAGVASDFVNINRQKAELQAVADAAAVAGARESILADSDEAQITSAATEAAKANLDKSNREKGTVRVDVEVLEKGSAVRVSVTRKWKPYFKTILGVNHTLVETAATARLVSAGKVCVIGMQESTVAAVHLDDSATLTANNCGVYSNSTSSWSLRVDSNAQLKAEWICAVGGYGGLQSSQIEPKPTTDCPPLPNPLSDRSTPGQGGCDHVGKVVILNETLSPGTYCGGLIVSGIAEVKLKPGIYVIKGGSLLVQDGAELTGEGVGFFLADDLAMFQFFPNTTISLSAPEIGPMAGLLFFENPANSLLATPRVHIVTSNNARQLLGTFYLPRSVLLVDALAPVADQSAYTAIVALRLWLREGPNLVLNANYSATHVPVPKGLSGSRIVLSE